MTTQTVPDIGPRADVDSKFESLLLQLVGEPFLFLKRSYGGELVLYFGTPLLGPPRRAGARVFRHAHATHNLHLRGSAWLIKAGAAPATFTGGMEADFEAVLGPPTRRADVEQEHPFAPGARVTATTPFLVTRPDVDGIGLRVDLSDGSAVVVVPTAAEPFAEEPEGERPPLADWELKTPVGRLEVGPGRRWQLAPMEYQIQFVVAPERLIRAADEILKARIGVAQKTERAVRAVAKAYIDEADEIKRAAEEFRRNTGRAQLRTLSPPEVIEKARELRGLVIPKKPLQEKIRAVAESYLHLAAENQRLYEEFLSRYLGHPPTGG